MLPELALTLRDIPRFPPPWAYANAGRPDERRGRVAVRRAFVELKLVFMRAAAEVRGETGQQLQLLVRQAGEPIELWLMRSTLLAALPRDGLDRDSAEAHRLAISGALAQVYPGVEPRGETLGRR